MGIGIDTRVESDHLVKHGPFTVRVLDVAPDVAADKTAGFLEEHDYFGLCALPLPDIVTVEPVAPVSRNSNPATVSLITIHEPFYKMPKPEVAAAQNPDQIAMFIAEAGEQAIRLSVDPAHLN